MPRRDRIGAATRAVAELLRSSWRPPGFAHVPTPDAALFLTAIDHKTGYEREHLVGGRGPFSGSELLWELGCDPGRAGPDGLRAERLVEISGGELAAIFEIEGDGVAGPDTRVRLWREIARGLGEGYGGEAQALIDAAAGRLAGPGGLLERLAAFEAYQDPLAKKSFLLAKIAERRGWLEVVDPESWEVSADNVLMRLCLRSGLVEPGPLERVRADTRAALKELAAAVGVSPPVLDDLLWELGREDPDLLGNVAGDLREPPRDPASYWY